VHLKGPISSIFFLQLLHARKLHPSFPKLNFTVLATLTQQIFRWVISLPSTKKFAAVRIPQHITNNYKATYIKLWSKFDILITAMRAHG